MLAFGAALAAALLVCSMASAADGKAAKKKASAKAAADAGTDGGWIAAAFENAPAVDADLSPAVAEPVTSYVPNEARDAGVAVAANGVPPAKGARAPAGTDAAAPASSPPAAESGQSRVMWWSDALSAAGGGDAKEIARDEVLTASGKMWRALEAPNAGPRECQPDTSKKNDPDPPLVLVLAPDGTLACSLPDAVDESRRFELKIWACFDPSTRYTVGVEEGARVTDWIRGVAKTGADTAPKVLDDEGCGVLSLVTGIGGKPLALGPYFGDASVTFHVAWPDASVDSKVTVPLAHHYLLNLGLAVLAGSGTTTYSVANKTVQADSTKIDLSYDAIVQFYPFATYLRDGHRRWGRTFDTNDGWLWENPRRRFFLAGGFSVSSPASSFFLGGGYELAPGVNAVIGWQPKRVQQLKPGWVPGLPDADSTPPTNTIWALDSMAIGLSLDAAFAKAVASAVGFK